MSGQCASAQRCISSYRLDACNRSRFCTYLFPLGQTSSGMVVCLRSDIFGSAMLCVTCTMLSA